AGNDGGGGEGEAARMGELEADQEVVGVAAALAVLLPGEGDEPLELGKVVLGEEELPGVGAAFGDDGARLAPEDLRAAAGEARPAVIGDLVRPPLERAVASLH